MDIIANEVRYVEQLLKNKQLTPRKATKEIRLVVQYYLSKGFAQEEVLNLTIKFINEVNRDGSGCRWQRTINGMIKDITKKNDLQMREVDEVVVTKKEIEVIKQLSNKRERKYAWGLLVLCKIINHGKQSQWVTIDNASAFCKFIGLRISTANDRELVFNGLKDKGLVVNSKMNKTSMKLLFVEDEGEMVYSFPTYNKATMQENYKTNAMFLYNLIFDGAKTYQCKHCGCYEKVEKRSKPMYCPTCAELKKRKRGVFSE